MTDVTLTADQIEILKRYLPAFRKYLRGPQYKSDRSDRAARVVLFQAELPERLAEWNEADVTRLVQTLYSTAMWGNKAYLAQTIVTNNGLEKLRQEVVALLDRATAPEERYARFVHGIKGLGPAAATEMLCYLQPEACGIWNQVARRALKILGLDGYVNVGKWYLSASEYGRFNSLLHAIADQLRAAGIDDVDLLLVDYFLYEVTQGVAEPEQLLVQGFDHDEMRDLLQNIGVMLGFDAATEVGVAHGARVDVVWRAQIGNLGLVTYVFEVQQAGSVDSLLLNLQRAKNNPSVQKVVAVSTAEVLERIRKETQGLPAEFCSALAFWDASEVRKVSDSLQTAAEIINRLGLVQKEF